MKITLTEADKPHILDIGVHPDNEVYNFCDVVKEGDTWKFSADQHNLADVIGNNLRKILKGMPSNYIFLTGVAPHWLRSNTLMLLRDSVAAVFLTDGKTASLVETCPPLTRPLSLQLN